MNFKEKLLHALQIDMNKYQELIKDCSIDDLEDPLVFDNILKLKNVILDSISKQEKIFVYGDYDADGITSTSIIVKTLIKLNAEVGYFIPNRYEDGYGLNINRVEQAASKGYKLIITVDNGVSQHEAIAKAYELGLKVVIIDHHEILNQLPECEAVVHPFLKNADKLAECGAYCSLMVSNVLLGYFDEYLVALAGLATISDLMPLIQDNRTIVKCALKILNKNKYQTFQKLDYSYPYDEKTLGFSIAPKINAVGRIYKKNEANLIVKYFISEDEKEINAIAEFINAANEKRKDLLKNAISNLIGIDTSKNIIITIVDNIDEGLVGLLAARLQNQYSLPAIVFAKTDGVLKGSVRSINGLSISNALKEQENLLESFGGHDLAAGVSLKIENYQLFKKNLEDRCRNIIYTQAQDIIIPVDKDELSFDNYQILCSLKPFGNQFNEPSFDLKILQNEVKRLNYTNHIKGIINSECSYIGFNLFDKIGPDKTFYHLVGKLELDNFKKGRNISFKVQKID